MVALLLRGSSVAASLVFVLQGGSQRAERQRRLATREEEVGEHGEGDGSGWGCFFGGQAPRERELDAAGELLLLLLLLLGSRDIDAKRDESGF